MNPRLAALGTAAAAVVAVPATLLAPRGAPPPPSPPVVPAPIVPAPAAPLDAALARDPFAATGDAAAAEDVPPAPADDAPALAGIVGRLPDRAVALVRRPGGGTRMLAPGESVDGWRLEALSAEAALFARGARRERVGVTE